MAFYQRRQAAEYLNARGLRITSTTLATAACRGGGPPFAIFGGRAVYRESDLDRWADAQVHRAFSTATERRAALRAKETETRDGTAKQPSEGGMS